MSKFFMLAIDIFTAIIGLLGIALSSYCVYSYVGYTMYTKAIASTGLFFISLGVFELYFKKIRPKVRRKLMSCIVLDNDQPIHMLKFAFLSFLVALWHHALNSSGRELSDMLFPSMFTAFFLLMIAYSRKKEKYTNAFAKINARHGTMFLPSSGEVVYVDQSTGMVLIVDGNYIRLEHALFILSYEGSVKTDMGKNGIASSYVDAIFKINDPSHPVVRARMSTEKYHTVTAILNNMWKNLQAKS